MSNWRRRFSASRAKPKDLGSPFAARQSCIIRDWPVSATRKTAIEPARIRLPASARGLPVSRAGDPPAHARSPMLRQASSLDNEDELEQPINNSEPKSKYFNRKIMHALYSQKPVSARPKSATVACGCSTVGSYFGLTAISGKSDTDPAVPPADASTRAHSTSARTHTSCSSATAPSYSDPAGTTGIRSRETVPRARCTSPR